jgi:hypothetical protein
VTVTLAKDIEIATPIAGSPAFLAICKNNAPISASTVMARKTMIKSS